MVKRMVFILSVGFTALLFMMFLGSAKAQSPFNYSTVCEDDPVNAGWRVCQSYWNLGQWNCGAESVPEFKIRHYQILPAEAPPTTTLWITSVHYSVYNTPSGFNGYIWYPAGYYNLCHVAPGARSCERTLPGPGVWLKPGDWIGGWAACSTSGYTQPTVGWVMRYKP
jgi:hypothetical protein